MLLGKYQQNVTIADTLHTYTQTNIHQPREDNHHCHFLNMSKSQVGAMGQSESIVYNMYYEVPFYSLQDEEVRTEKLYHGKSGIQTDWAIYCTLEAKVIAKENLLHQSPKRTSINGWGQQSNRKKEQIGSTTPMGESLPQNISFAGSALIWKETAPLRPRRPDHHSHDRLLKRTYPLTFGQSSQ